MKKITPIQKAIISMFIENTGSHFLDSGKAYGRNQERNQHINFLEQPAIQIETWKDSVTVYLSTFWFLVTNLSIT